MIAAVVILSMFLSQNGGAPDGPPPPTSPPPLLSAPDGPPVAQPGQLPNRLSDAPPGTMRNEPPPEEAEDRPGTPTAWWKRSLATFGLGIGVGGALGAGVALISWQLACGGAVCQGSDLFGIFAVAGLTAMFTIPAAVSLLGRALGGRAKYGYALIGSALFGAAGLIVALVMTGGTDVPVAVIPIFSALMVLGAVGSFELFSFLKERSSVKAEPTLGLLPGGGSVGIRATF